MSFSRHFKINLLVLVALAVVLAGCSPASPGIPEAAEPTGVSPEDAQPTITPAPTEIPERTLVVCLGEEPRTLYRYGGSSEAMWSVLEAVYDGPIDTLGFALQPVVLDKLPTLQDGDAVYQALDVQPGEIVVDVNGDLVSLADGVIVRPAGCAGPECAVTWDSTVPVQMDRLVINFSLKAGLTWADGAPLTSDDSLYAYELASDPGTPVSQYVLKRTLSYTALEQRTTQWTGLPGYFPLRFGDLYWAPLPRHAWGHLASSDLLTSELSTRTPLGWGPYVIEEWVAGDHIRLSKNPNYLRAAEGLPKFETLVFRFLGRPADSTLAALQAGECDAVDRSTGLDGQVQAAREAELNGKLQTVIGQGPEWEQVVFGIQPAAYDDPSQRLATNRADLFSDLRVRQAITMCMNRERTVSYALFNQSAVPATFLPPDHPLYAPGVEFLPFNLEEANRLLEESGWIDHDGDASTPRQAFEMPRVAEGAPLVVEYSTTGALLRQEYANTLKDALALCGVQLEVRTYEPQQFYEPGPNGPLFGRSFDLAQLAWQAGISTPCALFTSDQIPSAENNWIGTNVAGYSDAEYDAACYAALQTRPDHPEYTARNQDVQRLFASSLPAAPLFYRIKVAAARPDLCGLTMETSARSDLWNLETWDIGAGCQ
jgi:peptide/nickel transport system substrate-binding protein